jgi:hypothetical protein
LFIDFERYPPMRLLAHRLINLAVTASLDDTDSCACLKNSF